MGQYVSDVDRIWVFSRCPTEDPPGSWAAKYVSKLGANKATFDPSNAADTALMTAAAVSFAAFDAAAKTELTLWYTDHREVVEHEGETYNERKEVWKAFTEVTT